MSRDIKFRAWDVFNAEMFPGKINDDLLVKFFRDVNTRRNGGNCVHVMQFSGLQDSKGVDIYEGDIVYLAGYGQYEAEFPFTELYNAKAENDLGEIVGCIYS